MYGSANWLIRRRQNRIIRYSWNVNIRVMHVIPGMLLQEKHLHTADKHSERNIKVSVSHIRTTKKILTLGNRFISSLKKAIKDHTDQIIGTGQQRPSKVKKIK